MLYRLSYSRAGVSIAPCPGLGKGGRPRAGRRCRSAAASCIQRPVEVLAQGRDYAVVDAPAGDLDLARLAAALCCEVVALHPVGSSDPEVGGLRLVAR
jgi:hypothetical protein